jgi:hypothetical protein
MKGWSVTASYAVELHVYGVFFWIVGVYGQVDIPLGSEPGGVRTYSAAFSICGTATEFQKICLKLA